MLHDSCLDLFNHVLMQNSTDEHTLWCTSNSEIVLVNIEGWNLFHAAFVMFLIFWFLYSYVFLLFEYKDDSFFFTSTKLNMISEACVSGQDVYTCVLLKALLMCCDWVWLLLATWKCFMQEEGVVNMKKCAKYNWVNSTDEITRFSKETNNYCLISFSTLIQHQTARKQ